MYFSNEFIERVRSASNIEDVISGYVKLQRKGTSYMGLCPFHNEKTPSFSVHPARQTYHCFGCGESGDVFNFLMRYEGLDFQEAVQQLANRAGIALPEQEFSPEQRKEASERSRLLEIQKDAATFYYVRLHSPEGKVAMDYLTGRGLSMETIKKFALGYSGRTGGGLYAALKKKGYTDALLKESGLFTWKEDRSQLQEKFWNRVMFPIMDLNRRVIGFGGRVFGDAKPKYLNSPETRLFDKSMNLYGMYAARSVRTKRIIICEGYMDVISLHQAGFTNAVASLGTALTSQQAALLHRFAKEILLLYDSDGAGIQAALRAIPLLRNAGLNSRVVNLKPYKDPDELLKACGREELEKRIEKAENGFLFEIRMLHEQYDMADPQAASDFQHEAAKRLAAFPDEIERENYMKSVSRLYAIPPDMLKRQIGRLAMKGPQKEPAPAMQERSGRKEKHAAGERAEKTLLSWMSRSRELTGWAKEAVREEDFSVPMHKEIARQLFSMYDTGDFRPVSILNLFEENEEKSKAAAVLEEAPAREGEELYKAAGEMILIIRTESLKRRLQALPGSDLGALQNMMEEKKKLEELKKKLRQGRAGAAGGEGI